jgi:hypothetical protein
MLILFSLNLSVRFEISSRIYIHLRGIFSGAKETIHVCIFIYIYLFSTRQLSLAYLAESQRRLRYLKGHLLDLPKDDALIKDFLLLLYRVDQRTASIYVCSCVS